MNRNIKVLVVGAGKAGELISADIIENKKSSYDIVGFVDDAKEKLGKKINGIEVLGSVSDLNKVVKDNGIDEILIAIPSERGQTIRKIVENTTGLELVYRILPRRSEVLAQDFNKDYQKYLRRLQPEDLLGGEIQKTDQEDIANHTKNEIIMITGAAGSIGSELSRQVAAYGAKKIIFFDWWENGMFDLCNQILENYPKGDYEFVIGDVKDRKKMNMLMRKFNPTTIFHAAAYKHVPLMEDNPSEAIKNNIIGTKTVGEVAIKHRVKKFILVSTDKAVNPTNIMGATKRAAEKTIHILSESQKGTAFFAVRFGNVINSNGSAIPIFERQIEKGGPVTVTHKDITRYFMTIPEAVHLILQAWVMGENNDLFVLDMGEPVKIYHLAELLISLHGYTPNEDIGIEIVGLRPGEKLYEEVLVNEEETQSTNIEKVYKTKNYLKFDRLAFTNNLTMLLESLEENGLDITNIQNRLKTLVSTYKPKYK